MGSLPDQQAESNSIFNPKTPEAAKALRELVQWSQEGFNHAKNDRWKQERQWALNLSFYRGKQNVEFRGGSVGNNRDIQLYTPPAPYWKQRPVFNIIEPAMLHEQAKLTAQKPTAYITPASTERNDEYAALAGEQIWESLYDRHKISERIKGAVFWQSITGNGFLKCYWDPYKFDDEGIQGDICYHPLSPWHVFIPDMRELEIEDQPWLQHVKIVNVEEISRQFDGRPINFERSKTDIEDSYLEILNAQIQKDKLCSLQEIWVKPGVHRHLPDGGMFVVAGNQVMIGYEGQAYSHGRYPVAHLYNRPTGQFYRESAITALIPVQKEYNRTRAQMIESKNRMSKPQLLAEQGSVDVTKMTSEPGQVHLYKPGFNPPVPLQLQDLPSYVQNELERLRQDFDDISGQHEVSRGQNPSGVTAATAINYLQEQDDTKLANAYASVEKAVEKIARLSLIYVKDYWSVPRTVKVTGIDGYFDALTFTGSKIADNTDIKIEGGSALPQSKAARQAYVMEMMDKGYILPEQGLEVLDIGGLNKIYERLQVDKKQAGRENAKMSKVTPELIEQSNQIQMQKFMADPNNLNNPNYRIDPTTQQLLDFGPVEMGGEPIPIQMPLIIPVNTWDNHPIHLQVHNDYRKSQAYDSLTDAAKEIFEAHCQGHQMAMATGVPGGVPVDSSMMGMETGQQPTLPGMEMEAETPNPMGENQFSPPQPTEGMMQ